MRPIRNWSIRTRLFLAFVGVLIPFVAFTSIAVVGFRTLWQSLSAVQEEATLDLKRTSDVVSALDQLRLEAKNYVVSNGREELQRVERHLAHFREALRLLGTTPFQMQEEPILLEEVRALASQIVVLSRQILSIPDPKANRAIPLKMRELDRLCDQTGAHLHRLIDIHVSEIDQAMGRATYVTKSVEPIAFGAVLVGLVGAVGLSVIFSAWLSRLMQAIARWTRQMAEADLSQRVAAQEGGRLGETVSAFSRMAERLEASAIENARLVAIINHLRDFSRQSKGKRQVTDLNQVVTGALAFLAQQLKTKNIAAVQELVPALPPVWADPLQIEQVLLNLITNARDAMEAAGMGTITIRTEMTSDGRVALSVTDTGPGIPPDLQARIFDPVFTTKEVGKGTGLGLSICHGIIEEHGGELTMESPVADGRGTRFTIILPLSLRVDSERDRA